MGRLIGIVSEYRGFSKVSESELYNSDPIPIPKRFFKYTGHKIKSSNTELCWGVHEMFLKFLHPFFTIFQSIKLIPTIRYVTIRRDKFVSELIRQKIK